MIKRIVRKLPIGVKWLFYFIGYEAIFVVFSRVASANSAGALPKPGLFPSVWIPSGMTSGAVYEWLYLAAATAAIGMLCFLGYWENRRFIQDVNDSLKDAINDRNLGSGVDHLVEGKTEFDVHANIQNFLLLLKSFDTMKASRILLEMNTIKSIMNNSPIGIVLVNSEKVVTHINHHAEKCLKLIPGEILGQVISRKISNEVLLDQLHNALDDAHKITDAAFTIKEVGAIKLTIIPLKNKFGDIARGVIFLEPKEGNRVEPSK